MNSETFTLSQKELQRVAVISRCVQGTLACARAAELLAITPRHVKRLKARYRQGSAVALAHASLHRWLEDRGPQLTLLSFLDDTTRKVPVAEVFPTEDARGYFRLLRR